MTDSERDYIGEANAAALANVLYAEGARDAFVYAYSTIPDWLRRGTDGAYSAIAGALAGQVAEAYKRFFMWGILTIDEELREKARELAMRKFLHSQAHIMHHLEDNGEMPGSWLHEEEKAFRDQIAALMAQEEIDATERS